MNFLGVGRLTSKEAFRFW